jgi:hypothetical protein
MYLAILALLSRHPVFNQGDSSNTPLAPEAFRNFESEMESLQGMYGAKLVLDHNQCMQAHEQSLRKLGGR